MVVSSQFRTRAFPDSSCPAAQPAATHWFHERLRLDTTPSRKLLLKAAPAS